LCANEITQKVIRIFKELTEFEEEVELEPESKIKELGVNSISFVKSIVLFEEEFNVEFSYDKLDFAAFQTVNDIVDYIEVLLNKDVEQKTLQSCESI
jgi:acyl carrier protein